MATIPAATPFETMSAPAEPTVAKPEHIYEKAESVSSSHDDEPEKSQQYQSTPSNQENGSQLARRPSAAPSEQYPEGKQVALIMVAILLAVFLMALDRTIIATAVSRHTLERSHTKLTSS